MLSDWSLWLLFTLGPDWCKIACECVVLSSILPFVIISSQVFDIELFSVSIVFVILVVYYLSLRIDHNAPFWALLISVLLAVFVCWTFSFPDCGSIQLRVNEFCDYYGIWPTLTRPANSGGRYWLELDGGGELSTYWINQPIGIGLWVILSPVVVSFGLFTPLDVFLIVTVSIWALVILYNYFFG